MGYIYWSYTIKKKKISLSQKKKKKNLYEYFITLIPYENHYGRRTWQFDTLKRKRKRKRKLPLGKPTIGCK